MNIDDIEINSSPKKAMFYSALAKTVKGTPVNSPHPGDPAVPTAGFQKSYNFSSITDVALGKATLTFTTNKTNVKYYIATGLIRTISMVEQTGPQTIRNRATTGFMIAAQDNDTNGFSNWAAYYVGVIDG